MRKKYLTETLRRIKNLDVRWLSQQTKKAVAIPLETVTERCFTGPLLASLAITYRCNQRCAYCDLPSRADARNEISTDRVKAIIDDLALLDVSSISFTGGEPLLRKDVFELIRHIKKYGISTNLTTNGMLVTQETAAEIVACGLDSLGVSIDSSDKTYVNEMRGSPKAFDGAVDAIKRTAEAKLKMNSDTPNITVSSVLTSNNCEYVAELISLAKSSGANAISFGGVQVNFDTSGKIDLKKHVEDKARLAGAIKQILELRKMDPFIDNSKSYLEHLGGYISDGWPGIKCYAGYHSILIDCFGGIFPCFQYYEKNTPVENMENVKSLPDFWYGEKYGELRKKLLKCRECFFVCQMEPNELYNKFTGLR